MNVEMWLNPANQRDIAQLVRRHYCLYAGLGRTGLRRKWYGKDAEPAELLDLLPRLVDPKNFRDKKILITAGATFEAIDLSGHHKYFQRENGRSFGAGVSCRRCGSQPDLRDNFKPNCLSVYPIGFKPSVLKICIVRASFNRQTRCFYFLPPISDYQRLKQGTQKFKR